MTLLLYWAFLNYKGAMHLTALLDEYTFRFNRRTSRSRDKLFYRLVQQAVAIDPVLAKDI